MNFKNVISISSMLLVGLMSSCSNQLDSGLASKKSSGDHSGSESTGTVTAPPVQGQNLLATVNLGVANSFAILSKSGVTDVYKSSVTGDVGSSPITGAAILLTCPEVSGSIFTVDAAGPLPCRITNPSMLTTAVSNMQTAYTDAAGRSNPKFLNLGAGNIGGKTLTPGLYKFTQQLLFQPI
ncbi:MAG: ice-binding family protein [Paludibacter sp.]|nr:ice-binding family protein [Paludibacter sp.]